MPIVNYRASRYRRITGAGLLPGELICSPFMHLFPRLAAPDAGRLFRDDVRARAGVLVSDLDQDPPLLAGPRQREAARQLAAVQDERHVARFVADDVGGPNDRSTSPDCKRKSKCCVVASCSCTTKRGEATTPSVCAASRVSCPRRVPFG